jgi:hypothetical protein
MKLLRLSLLTVLLAVSFTTHAAWDIWQAYIITNVNSGGNTYQQAGLDLSDPTTTMVNRYYGRFTTGNSLVIAGGEIKTYKNGSSDVCGGNINYRVYRTCDSPPSFTSIGLGFSCNFPCTGLNSAGDQKWSTSSGTTNILSALTASGTYIIEVYWDATGDDSNPCGGAGDYVKPANNGGLNFRAYFEFEMNDNFTDLDFNTPTWNGDVSNFSTIANSTCSGLTGSEAFRTHTAKLNVASGSGTQHISTQIATWDTQQEWYFWVGRNGLGGSPSDLDANNQQAVYLYSNASDLESSLNGYRILLGQTGTSYVRLQRIDSGTATTIFTSSTGIPTGLTDYGVSFKVTRSQLGVWTIRTSTLPTNGANTQATPTPNSCPESLSTVNHGSVTDNTYAPAANGYFGFMAIHDATTEGRAAAEFDNFRLEALPPDTYLAINGSVTGSVNEDANLAGNYAIGVDIFNPSSTVATTIDVVLTSGSAARIGGGPLASTAYAPSYTTQTLTWTAGQTGTKYIYIDPNNNALCDDIATLVFQLQNVTGGTNAFVGTPSSLTLTLVDDDMGYETLVSENFNSGALGSWVTTGTSWSASTSTPIEGSHSARHSTQGTAGQSSLTYPIDNASLTGLNTTWRFEVAFANDATANNNFQIFLSANKDSLTSTFDLDGYAVVIDQSSLPSAGSSDYIRLYRVDNGTYASTPIVNSTTDWVDNVNSGTRVGFEVTLNDAGTWNLKVDADGGFDALSSLGTGTDIGGGGLTYPAMNKFGIRFNYLASASDLIRFDNISVTQSGCKEIYYSRSTGNSDGAIWSTAASGLPAPSTIVSGRYDRFVIQAGHNVTAVGSWLMNDITIENTATLTGGSSSMKVHGNWINEGTFTAGTSNVTFKGQAAQSIGFSANAVNTTFNNLTIDNDGFTVTIDSAAVSVTGVVSMLEGTLQTSPGGLTLISNSMGSASIGEIVSGAVVSGNITLQRYLPPIATVQGYWMNIGNPLLGQTIASWNDDITTTGFTGSDFPTYPFNNINYYDETVSGLMNTGYVPATNVTNALETSRGYFVWIEGASDVISTTGQIQSGTFTQALSHTTTGSGVFHDGWNLMTNMYPSEVDWNLLSSTLSGPKVYYVYDYESGAYKFRNAATNTGTASRYIAHSQSFLVKVNTTGQSLSYQENYKTNTGAAFERSNDSENSFIALQLAGNGLSDESMLMFDNNAVNAYDYNDVLDLESPIATSVEFSLMSADDVPLAQDARPFNNDINIPVSLDLPSAGTYMFSVSESQNLPLGSCLYIEDMVTGNVINLLEGEVMMITTDAPFNGVRLIIHGTAPIALLSTDATCNGYADGTVDITTPSGEWSVSLTSEENNFEYVSNGSITFDHLAAGIYTLEVLNTNEACGSQSAQIEISEPAQIQSSINNQTIVSCNEGNEGAFTINVNNANWFTYEVFDSQENLIRSGEVEGAVFTAEELTADIYSVNIYTTCNTEVIAVDLRDPESLTAEVAITQSADAFNGFYDVTLSAITDNAPFVNWTLSNGQSFTGNEINTQLTAGTYGYQVELGGNCSSVETGTFQINTTTAVNESSKTNQVTLIQNAYSVNLNFNETFDGLTEVSVYDIQGKLMMTIGKNVTSGQSIFIDMNEFSAGIYNLLVTNEGNKVFSAQVFKQ